VQLHRVEGLEAQRAGGGVAAAHQLAQRLVAGALGAGERPPRDDIAVLALRARG
jgi:hypothetical protein